MLDGIHDVYLQSGQFLGTFQDLMVPELQVCAYVFHTVEIGQLLILEETRAHRAQTVKVIGKSIHPRYGNILKFDKLSDTRFPIEKPMGKRRSWAHFWADGLGLGKNPTFAKIVSFVLPSGAIFGIVLLIRHWM